MHKWILNYGSHLGAIRTITSHVLLMSSNKSHRLVPKSCSTHESLHIPIFVTLTRNSITSFLFSELNALMTGELLM